MDDRRRAGIREIATALKAAERPVRVLGSIAWPAAAKERFFERGARELPEVCLDPVPAEPVLELLAPVRAAMDPGDPLHRWLARVADSIEGGARMLAAIGRPEFAQHGGRLYGTPRSPMPGGGLDSLQLAQAIHETLDATSHVDLGAPPPACHMAQAVAQHLREACVRFGADAPEVVVVDQLSANALAGPRAIRIRRDACFTDQDAEQLVQHEAYVHVGTSLNGRAQTELPILAGGHPGTTRTQEGLAVFAEWITGLLDPDRLSRLADRVQAIQLCLDGADFLEVYRFFLERGVEEHAAYEHARRVFRGGVLSGGAPFTKDVVYLHGFLQVQNFLRVAIASGRADIVRLLFCGKLDIEDLPALATLREAGLCVPPRHLPPWAEDLRSLVASLALSAFLNRVDLSAVRSHYAELLEGAPNPE